MKWTKPIAAGIAWMIAIALQVVPQTWPTLLHPHPWAVGGFILAGTIMFAYAAVEKKQIGGPVNSVGRDNSGSLINAKNAHVHIIHNPPPPLPPDTSQNVSPLEIIFDPTNPARRFWSLESHKDDSGKAHPYWEHRVEIRNNSLKTIRNVMVTVERTGQLPQLPFSPPFKRQQTDKCDINPSCSELIRVNIWSHPKQQEGNLCGESAWAYGPIKVTASGDDTLSVVKIFEFHYETEQMLFDKEIYPNADSTMAPKY